MNQDHLKHILELISRTGDRMVLVDNDFEKPFVVMDIENYEDLIDAIDGGESYDHIDFSDDTLDLPNFDVAEPKMHDEFDMFPDESNDDVGNLTSNKASAILEPAESTPKYVPIDPGTEQTELHLDAPVPVIESAEEVQNLEEGVHLIPKIGSAEDVPLSAPDSEEEDISSPEFLPEPI
jgi:hypothetical protein